MHIKNISPEAWSEATYHVIWTYVSLPDLFSQFEDQILIGTFCTFPKSASLFPLPISVCRFSDDSFATLQGSFLLRMLTVIQLKNNVLTYETVMSAM